MNLWMKMSNLSRTDIKSNKDPLFSPIIIPSSIRSSFPLSPHFLVSSLHVYYHFLFITIDKKVASSIIYRVLFKAPKCTRDGYILLLSNLGGDLSENSGLHGINCGLNVAHIHRQNMKGALLLLLTLRIGFHQV